MTREQAGERAGPTRNVADELAADLAAAARTPLSADLADRAASCVMDSVGCILGATAVPEARLVAGYVAAMGGAAESSTPLSETRSPAALAAYVNGALANALDFDDTIAGLGHPGATVVSAALAIAEREGAESRRFLAAVAAGYEISVRIARAAAPTHARARQVRGIATWQVFGAAAAASVILGLDEGGAARALGLAAAHAPVPFVGRWYERPIAWVKNNMGWAAMGGVIAADLAARGVRVNTAIFDGDTGFWAMAGSDRFEPSYLAGGARHALLDVAFKPYASCRHTHSAIEAVHRMREHGAWDGDADAVAEIVVRGPAKLAVFDDPSPSGLIDAQFSLPVLCAAVLAGRFSPNGALGRDVHADPVVRRLARKVRIVADPSFADDAEHHPCGAEVEIVLTDGRRDRERIEAPLGGPERPGTSEDLDAKFTELATEAIGERAAVALRAAIRGMPAGGACDAIPAAFREAARLAAMRAP